MKILRYQKIQGFWLRKMLAITALFTIAVAGFVSDASALTYSSISTSSQIPYNIAVDQNTGETYFTAGLTGANLGISKIANGGITSVWSDIGLGYTNALAAGDGYLFWGNANSGPGTSSQNFRASESGTGSITLMTGGYNVFDISDVAYQASSDYLYTADFAYGRIGRMDANGNNWQYLGQPPWSGYYEQYISIALSSDKIFERKNEGIYSFPINGGGSTLLTTGNFYTLAYYNNTIYAIDSDQHNTIWQISTSTGAASLLWGGNEFGVFSDIAAYDGMLYVTAPQLQTIWKVDLNAEPVPEPATMLLLGSGLVGLAGFRRKFRKK